MMGKTARQRGPEGWRDLTTKVPASLCSQLQKKIYESPLLSLCALWIQNKWPMEDGLTKLETMPLIFVLQNWTTVYLKYKRRHFVEWNCHY